MLSRPLQITFRPLLPQNNAKICSKIVENHRFFQLVRGTQGAQIVIKTCLWRPKTGSGTTPIPWNSAYESATYEINYLQKIQKSALEKSVIQALKIFNGAWHANQSASCFLYMKSVKLINYRVQKVDKTSQGHIPVTFQTNFGHKLENLLMLRFSYR